MFVFKRHWFPAEIALLCVRWYCRYGISYRDLEEMMGERGDHTTVYRWMQRYAPEFREAGALVAGVGTRRLSITSASAV